MANVYIYADETGDLGYDSNAPYFGLGTATFVGDHGDALWEGFKLRVALEKSGVKLRKGLHAKNDSHRVRDQVFNVIASQKPRFDMTFLYKENAYPRVRKRGDAYLYKQAFWFHFKETLRLASQPGDDIFVIAGHLQTNAKREAILEAVTDVCQQISWDRQVTPCVWDAPTSWGIQVADYGLWSAQRELLGKGSAWHERCIKPTLASFFFPWGKHHP